MAEFKVSIFDELEHLYPDSTIDKEVKEYTVSCASNTYGGIHILLKNLEPGQPVAFKVKGPNSKFKLFKLIPVPVEINTGLETRSELIDKKFNPYVIRRAPFMIYEVLEPIVNICNAEYSTMAFAFRCKVYTEEPHRIDNWQITIIHGGNEKTLSFTVESHGIKVMETSQHSYKYINWLSDKAIASSHHVELWSKEWELLLEKYLKLCSYGRQNMFCIWPHWYFDIDENNKPILNKYKLTRLIEIANNSGIYWLCGGTMIQRKNGEWGATTAEITMTKQLIPGDGEEVLKEMAKATYDFIKSKGVHNRWVQSLLDEPLDELSETYKLGSDIVRKEMKNILLLEATIARETITGAVDIWCPTVDKYEKYKDFFVERKANGDKVFVYTCLNPAGNFCNRQLDVERLRQVYIGWAAGKYDVDGFLHWGGNMYNTSDPFHISSINVLDRETVSTIDYQGEKPSTLPPGDFCVIYPGYNTPLSSTRFEAHRIGFEDLELIKMAKSIDEEKTLQIIEKLFRRYDDFEKDINMYRKVKKELLNIVKSF